jgi:cell division protein FtsZ
VPVPGEIVVAFVAIAAVLLLLRILWVLPGWIRGVRRPEERTIRVVGVGGGGNNAVDRMVGEGIDGVSFVGFNTDAQALRRSTAKLKIRIGVETTGGLGSGGNPEVGRKAAEEDRKYIDRGVRGADLVVVTAGLGGGTGSGAAPVVAASAREQGALTIGVVTKPFGFEGTERKRIADAAAAELAENVDALIVVPNDRVGDVLPADASMIDAFHAVDDVLLHAIQGILDLINAPGLINLDFADVRSVMEGAGPAVIGIGRGSGEQRAADAARHAIASPLLEARFEGARGILFNVSGPPNLRFSEVRLAADAIREHADADANILFGASFSETLGEDVLVTLIATGLNGNGRHRDDKAARAAAVADAVTDVSTKPAVKRRPPKAAPQSVTAEPAPPVPETVDEPSSPEGEVEVAIATSPAETSAGDTPSTSLTPDEDDLEVPSFLRRRR